MFHFRAAELMLQRDDNSSRGSMEVAKFFLSEGSNGLKPGVGNWARGVMKKREDSVEYKETANSLEEAGKLSICRKEKMDIECHPRLWQLNRRRMEWKEWMKEQCGDQVTL